MILSKAVKQLSNAHTAERVTDAIKIIQSTGRHHALSRARGGFKAADLVHLRLRPVGRRAVLRPATPSNRSRKPGSMVSPRPAARRQR